MGNINTVPPNSADVMVSMIDELNQQAWKIHISEPKKALELSASAKKLSEENNYRKGLAYAIRNMGVSNRYLSNLEIALSLSVQALDLFVEMGDMSGEAQSCVSIGAIYYYIGDYVRSTDYLLKGLKLSEEVGNKELQAYAYNGVGYNYGIMGDIKKGLEYLHKALELSKAVEVDHDLQPRVLDSMAETYLNDGQMDKAFECYNESLQLCEKSGHKLMKSQVFLGIGNIFVMQKRFSEAGEYFIKSLEICGEISYQAFVSRQTFLATG
jgi:tetratricopeptide (TPR) repeat protein